MIRKYIFILLSAFCLGGCIEDETVDITVMPEISNTGANTFGCLVDGWLYVGGRYHTTFGSLNIKRSIDFEYYPEEEIMDVAVIVKEDKVIRFNIQSPQEGQETVFVNARINDEELENGTVNITRFDEQEHIISGTFSGGRIAHGRFDVHYLKNEYSYHRQ